MKRPCCLCGEEVKECMGSVLARDFIGFLAGTQTVVRELCPKCATLVANDKLVLTVNDLG